MTRGEVHILRGAAAYSARWVPAELETDYRLKEGSTSARQGLFLGRYWARLAHFYPELKIDSVSRQERGTSLDCDLMLEPRGGLSDLIGPVIQCRSQPSFYN